MKRDIYSAEKDYALDVINDRIFDIQETIQKMAHHINTLKEKNAEIISRVRKIHELSPEGEASDLAWDTWLIFGD